MDSVLQLAHNISNLETHWGIFTTSRGLNLVASQDALNVNFFNQFKINRRCGFARFVGADWLRLVLVLELLSGLDLEFGL